MLKRFFLLTLSLFMIFISGCKKKPKEVDPNADRPTNFTYDFVDFLNVKLYGSEGTGFLEITPKEFNVDNFSSEQEYIKVKRAIDSLSLYCIPGDQDTQSYLYIDKPEGLSNGDLVTIGIKDSYTGDLSEASLNTSPYIFTINGLTEPKQINLFDETSVYFYGLANTGEVNVIKHTGGNIPKEILDNIEYDIVPDETPLKAGKTVLRISATLNNDFLTQGEIPYYTTSIYLGKNKYAADLETEKVLMNVSSPIDFEKANKRKIAEKLFEEISLTEGGEGIMQVGSIQQIDSEEGSFDPYTYTVIFSAMGSEKTTKRATVRMVEADGDIQVLSVENIQKVTETALTEPLKDMKILMNYYVENIPEEEPEETTPAETKKTDEVKEDVHPEPTNAPALTTEGENSVETTTEVIPDADQGTVEVKVN